MWLRIGYQINKTWISPRTRNGCYQPIHILHIYIYIYVYLAFSLSLCIYLCIISTYSVVYEEIDITKQQLGDTLGYLDIYICSWHKTWNLCVIVWAVLTNLYRSSFRPFFLLFSFQIFPKHASSIRGSCEVQTSCSSHALPAATWDHLYHNPFSLNPFRPTPYIPKLSLWFPPLPIASHPLPAAAVSAARLRRLRTDASVARLVYAKWRQIFYMSVFEWIWNRVSQYPALAPCMPHWSIIAAPWASGTTWEPSGSLLEPPGGLLDYWPPAGTSLDRLGASWVHVGASWTSMDFRRVFLDFVRSSRSRSSSSSSIGDLTEI